MPTIYTVKYGGNVWKNEYTQPGAKLKAVDEASTALAKGNQDKIYYCMVRKAPSPVYSALTT